jgi:hypothetical protein
VASAPGILSRVPPESRHKLTTPLSAEHSTALRTMLTAGLLRPALDDETAGALIAAGYARQTVGGLALSDEGQVRALMELGQ